MRKSGPLTTKRSHELKISEYLIKVAKIEQILKKKI